jgi:hypothetical protein
VLLQDAARTPMKAAMPIRERGPKARMEEPAEFLERMNQLCLKTTHARRKKDGQRARKAVLREMKKLGKIVAAHAARHRGLLERGWQETEIAQGEARQIVGRIDTILERLPHAIRQAHERIVGERQLKNEEKIPSLYEGRAAVYVRGKAGAEVEFGSRLLLGESESGAIVDWELACGNPRADTKMLSRSLERPWQTAGGPSIRRVFGGPWIRQPGESRSAGERRDLPCDLSEGAWRTEKRSLRSYDTGARKPKLESPSSRTNSWAVLC